MLNKHIANVPKDERHWSSWLRICFLCIIPRIPISINATSAVTIDVNPLSSDDETSVVVLESNRIGVVAPVVEIV